MTQCYFPDANVDIIHIKTTLSSRITGLLMQIHYPEK